MGLFNSFKGTKIKEPTVPETGVTSYEVVVDGGDSVKNDHPNVSTDLALDRQREVIQTQARISELEKALSKRPESHTEALTLANGTPLAESEELEQREYEREMLRQWLAFYQECFRNDENQECFEELAQQAEILVPERPEGWVQLIYVPKGMTLEKILKRINELFRDVRLFHEYDHESEEVTIDNLPDKLDSDRSASDSAYAAWLDIKGPFKDDADNMHTYASERTVEEHLLTELKVWYDNDFQFRWPENKSDMICRGSSIVKSHETPIVYWEGPPRLPELGIGAWKPGKDKKKTFVPLSGNDDAARLNQTKMDDLRRLQTQPAKALPGHVVQNIISRAKDAFVMFRNNKKG
jgi:hypothetical protein